MFSNGSLLSITKSANLPFSILPKSSSKPIASAEAIGLEDDLGSIENGKLADLVILNKDPLENIRNTNEIEMVMIDGKLYNANNLNQVYPKKEKAVFNWHQSKPENIPGLK